MNLFGLSFLLFNVFNVYNLRLDIVQKSLWISSHCDRENHTWRLDIVFLSDFFGTNVSKHISENS